MNPDNVTHCMRCKESLERGYSSRWKGDECKEVICFDCDKREKVHEHIQTGHISTSFMMDCLMASMDLLRNHFGRDKYDYQSEKQILEMLALDERDCPEKDKLKLRVHLSTVRISAKIKEFESKVWFKGLQDMVLATNERGISARKDAFKVLTWTGMGRTMITFEDDKSSVTCVADETSKESRTGYHGISGTGEQALALIDRAITLYESGELKFELDKEVSLF